MNEKTLPVTTEPEAVGGELIPAGTASPAEAAQRAAELQATFSAAHESPAAAAALEEAVMWAEWKAGEMGVRELARKYRKDPSNLTKLAQKLGIERDKGPAIRREADRLAKRELAARDRAAEEAITRKAEADARRIEAEARDRVGDTSTTPTGLTTPAVPQGVPHPAVPQEPQAGKLTKRMTETEIERRAAQRSANVDIETKDAAGAVQRVSGKLLAQVEAAIDAHAVLTAPGARAILDDFAKALSGEKDLAGAVPLIRQLLDLRGQVETLKELGMALHRAGGGGSLNAAEAQRKFGKLDEEKKGGLADNEKFKAMMIRARRIGVDLEAARALPAPAAAKLLPASVSVNEPPVVIEAVAQRVDEDDRRRWLAVLERAARAHGFRDELAVLEHAAQPQLNSHGHPVPSRLNDADLTRIEWLRVEIARLAAEEAARQTDEEKR